MEGLSVVSDEGLTVAEAELYDRQIRLWGIESQEKLRAANVLLIGVKGLGSEIAKNILLSGIKSLTILDDAVVTEDHYHRNFLLRREDIGSKISEAVLLKAQALNPLVKVVADTSSLNEKTEEFFKTFTIIVATGLSTKEIFHLDSLCRKFKIQFISGDVFGMFGYSVSDFQEHDYYEDEIRLPSRIKRAHDGKVVPSSTEYIRKKVPRKVIYPPLDDVLSKSGKKIVNPSTVGRRKRLNELYYLVKLLIKFRDDNGRDPSSDSKEEDLKILKEMREVIMQDFSVAEEKLPESILNLLFGEIAPICSIIGGVMAQEVIKAVSHKEVPIHNMFLLDPKTYAGKEETVGVK